MLQLLLLIFSNRAGHSGRNEDLNWVQRAYEVHLMRIVLAVFISAFNVPALTRIIFFTYTFYHHFILFPFSRFLVFPISCISSFPVFPVVLLTLSFLFLLFLFYFIFYFIFSLLLRKLLSSLRCSSLLRRRRGSD